MLKKKTGITDVWRSAKLQIKLWESTERYENAIIHKS